MVEAETGTSSDDTQSADKNVSNCISISCCGDSLQHSSSSLNKSIVEQNIFVLNAACVPLHAYADDHGQRIRDRLAALDDEENDDDDDDRGHKRLFS